ncbi:hypothetical protein [Nocardia concava]|uniref:hypothetical protein n=1 Tax=Nocardia concava TaxID=257281 RepID=UPI0012F81133|nr:hypothetical protein [Nocardia concava]
MITPRRWRGPLDEALRLVESDYAPDLEKADLLLSQSLSRGPRRRALYEARLAQTFVRAMLGRTDNARYGAAAAAVEELTAAFGNDRTTARLALWIHARLENHDRVCDIYDQHQSLLSNDATGRRIVACSCLHLAATHWRRHEIEGAIHYFDKLRELGELEDRIPPGVDNLQLVKAIQALVDKREDDARVAFTEAREGAIERSQPTIEADIGILACDWTHGNAADLGERLSVVADGLVDFEPGSAYGRLRGPVALLELLALLWRWAARRAGSGPPNESDWRELSYLADAARQADSELGDPYLVEGVIRFYFAADSAEREQAISVLERGTNVAKPITLPEVLDLIAHERAKGGHEDAVTRHRILIREFLTDPMQTEALRAEYRLMSTRFEPYRSGAAVDCELPPAQTSVDEDSSQRATALRRRIELIIQPFRRDADPESEPIRELNNLLKVLDEATESHSIAINELRSAERRIMTHISNLLLPEGNIAEVDP